MLKGFSRGIVTIISLLSYIKIKEWFIPHFGKIWLIGYFEGLVTMIIICILAEKYSEAIYEIYLGLRELGRLRRIREDTA